VTERAVMVVGKSVKTIYNISKDCGNAHEGEREVVSPSSLGNKGVVYMWTILIHVLCKGNP
jgi:hypothetical protein